MQLVEKTNIEEQMDYESVKERLDRLVNLSKEALSISDFNSIFKTCLDSCFSSGIHVFSGIREIAEIMGLELKEVNRDTDEISHDFPWKYSFEYGGVVFFQLEKERLLGFGTD